MRRRVVVLAGLVILAVLTLTSCALAGLSDLTIDGPTYAINISEYQTGIYQGNITQYGAAKGAVYYSLPKITFFSGQPTQFSVFGVCIDINEYTGSPTQLRQGWDRTPPPGDQTFNGTVKDYGAWERTTYLFNQYANDLSTWWGTDGQKTAAFQLATWEVMSGDGSGGANWTSGGFTATGVTGNVQTLADAFVNDAYSNASAFSAWQVSKSADYALYLHDHQDFLVSAPAVPEIPAAALCPLGLAVVGLIKRRFAK